MIDPNSPAVIDVHDFRRPGESRRLHRVAQLGAEVGNPLVSLPADADIDLDVLLESVVEGVLANGEARYTLVGQCSRCLEPIAQEQATDFSQLFLWDPAHDAEGEEIPSVQDGLIDLTDEVRDAVGLDLPLAPVCEDGCRGLCSQCGVNLNDDPEHDHPTTDPRWDALAELELPRDE